MVVAWAKWKAGGPEEFVRTVSRPSKQMRVDHKAAQAYTHFVTGEEQFQQIYAVSLL